MQKHGLAAEEAAKNIWVLDKDGLVTLNRSVRPLLCNSSQSTFSFNESMVKVVNTQLSGNKHIVER